VAGIWEDVKANVEKMLDYSWTRVGDMAPPHYALVTWWVRSCKWKCDVECGCIGDVAVGDWWRWAGGPITRGIFDAVNGPHFKTMGTSLWRVRYLSLVVNELVQFEGIRSSF